MYTGSHNNILFRSVKLGRYIIGTRVFNARAPGNYHLIYIIIVYTSPD